MQQDANECWTDLVRTIKAALQSEGSLFNRPLYLVNFLGTIYLFMV